MYKRLKYHEVMKRLSQPRSFIQVLLGPRQVGKTTLALQVVDDIGHPSHYVSADSATLEDTVWIKAQWQIGRELAKEHGVALLVIDEVQKIPHWSDTIKQLWDEDTAADLDLKVCMLGSSPWLIQTGIQETLAGRFEVIPITHWSFKEMQEKFSWTLEQYIYFGGYPGAAKLADEENVSRWKRYINDSLIETTLSRDILLMTQVQKPALLRRLFQLGCNYSGQVLSYQKMLGQLQDAGNTTTLAHYLDLLNGVSLLCGLPKYAGEVVRQKGSSPRFMVYNSALISAQHHYSYTQAKADPEYWGHLLESCVGSHLLNSVRGTDIKIFYWRAGNQEVDFIMQRGPEVIALEVKSGKLKKGLSGLENFAKQFKPTKLLLIGEQGISIEKFLSTPIENWFDML